MEIKYKMDANENPYPPPDELNQKLKKITLDLEYNRYPDPDSLSLRNKLSGYLRRPANTIIAGNGSDELILLSLMAFIDREQKVVFPVPTFGMYQFYAEKLGIQTERVKLGNDLKPDWDKLMKLGKKSKVGMFIFCSPNNPTGNIFSKQKIAQLASSTNSVILVDEAYAEISGHSSLDLLDKHENIIILRTFSKAFGLAGLRVGYMTASSAKISKIEDVCSPYNLNSFSQEVACYVLDEIQSYRDQWKKIRENRNYLMDRLKNINGIKIFPSQTNFILFKTSSSEKKVYDYCKEQRISIRYFADLEKFGDVLRVSVGRKEENNNFIEIIKRAVRREKVIYD